MVADGTAQIWDVATGRTIAILRGHADWVTSARFSPDQRCILTTSRDGDARLWDAVSGAGLAILRGHRDSLWKAVFSPDGAFVATVSEDRTVRLWDASNGCELAVLGGHDGAVLHPVFNAEGDLLLTCSRDGTARLWDVSRLWSLRYGPGVFLAAALGGGVGFRTEVERADLLMQAAPDDLHAAVLAELGRDANDGEMVASASILSGAPNSNFDATRA